LEQIANAINYVIRSLCLRYFQLQSYNFLWLVSIAYEKIGLV